MKIRMGMVSNSSSASFVIPLAALTPEQVQQILDYPQIAKRDYLDVWNISMNEFVVDGWTSMNDGDLRKYLEAIGVPNKAVRIYGD